MGWSQWPRGLRRRSTTARLLKLWVRIPPVAWISLCCECCVLLGRGLLRGDRSSREVLPTVAGRCVWSRNLVNEEAMAQWGAATPKTTINFGWWSGLVLTKQREGNIPAPKQKWGRAMFQDVSRRRLSSEAPVQPRTCPYGICGGCISTGICFAWLASGFICWYCSTNAVSSYFVHLLPMIYNTSNGQRG